MKIGNITWLEFKKNPNKNPQKTIVNENYIKQGDIMWANTRSIRSDYKTYVEVKIIATNKKYPKIPIVKRANSAHDIFHQHVSCLRHLNAKHIYENSKNKNPRTMQRRKHNIFI